MLPEMNALLRNILKRFDHEPESGFTLDVFFGYPVDQRLAELARRAFDLLRAPMLRLSIVRRERWELVSIRLLERSEARRVGKEVVGRLRSGWPRVHSTKKTNN